MKVSFSAVAIALFTILGSVTAENAQIAQTGKIRPLRANRVCQESIDNKGLVAANGTQIKAAPSCVSLNIGEIPIVDNMVSCLIIEPEYGQTIKKNEPFNVSISIQGIDTGFFSDPVADYYEIPQTLNEDGIIQGHSHVTIQFLGDKGGVPDPKIFAFFKGLNNAAVDGVLTQLVEKGLPKVGLYRICTMNSSNSHQPVVMPVAQRGAQDDCIRIFVE